MITGCFLLLFQQYLVSINTSSQFIIFLIGILLLGVPHGAADLLVANRNADTGKKVFSRVRFLAIYISRLFLFAAILWFFPVIGIILFIFLQPIILEKPTYISLKPIHFLESFLLFPTD